MRIIAFDAEIGRNGEDAKVAISEYTRHVGGPKG